MYQQPMGTVPKQTCVSEEIEACSSASRIISSHHENVFKISPILRNDDSRNPIESTEEEANRISSNMSLNFQCCTLMIKIHVSDDARTSLVNSQAPLSPRLRNRNSQPSTEKISFIGELSPKSHDPTLRISHPFPRSTST